MHMTVWKQQKVQRHWKDVPAPAVIDAVLEAPITIAEDVQVQAVAVGLKLPDGREVWFQR